MSLPRVSQDQFYAGQRVSWENIQGGDLLFFYDSVAPTHVGMATGDGRMIHASTSSKPIGVVSSPPTGRLRRAVRPGNRPRRAAQHDRPAAHDGEPCSSVPERPDHSA